MTLRARLVPLRSALAAARILRAEIGLAGTLRVLGAVAWREARGEPWRELGPPASAREAATRKQAGAVFLLVDELAPRLGPERAKAIAGRIAIRGAVLFLGSVVPSITRRWYRGIAPEDRPGVLGRILERFPNLTVGAMEANDDTFRFEAAGCAFADLCRRTGRPELAALFCAGDREYFERHGEAAFERPTTIAEGHGCCDFRFRWRDPP